MQEKVKNELAEKEVHLPTALPLLKLCSRAAPAASFLQELVNCFFINCGATEDLMGLLELESGALRCLLTSLWGQVCRLLMLTVRFVLSMDRQPASAGN